MTEIKSGSDLEFTEKTSVQAAVGTRWVELETESVVLDVLKDRVFRLNATAAYIWGRLQEPCYVADLEAALVDAYEIDPAEAKDATHALLDELAKEGLIGTTRSSRSE